MLVSVESLAETALRKGIMCDSFVIEIYEEKRRGIVKELSVKGISAHNDSQQLKRETHQNVVY
jgi:hypothetical protein